MRRMAAMVMTVVGLAPVRTQAADIGDWASAALGGLAVWEALSPREQARFVRLPVARVTYDGEKGKLAIAFHASGLKSLGRGASNTAEATA